LIAACVGVIAVTCALFPKQFDAESFSASIDSSVPAYDGFDIRSTLKNETGKTRHLMVSKVIFELESGYSEAYVSTKPLDQDVPGRSVVSDLLYLRNCPKPDHDNQFRLVYVLTEPYVPPPQIIHNAYSLFLDRGPPKWFTDLYEPRTHEVETQWFPVPQPETKSNGEQGGGGQPATRPESK
jgi:hypothetical protein